MSVASVGERSLGCARRAQCTHEAVEATNRTVAGVIAPARKRRKSHVSAELGQAQAIESRFRPEP